MKALGLIITICLWKIPRSKMSRKIEKKNSQSILVTERKRAPFVETVNEWFGNEWSSACTRCVFVCFFNFLEILLRENINEESIS